MPTTLSLAPYIPVSQGHTFIKPWWHSTLCCGLFDLALAAYIANDVKYTNIAICKQVDVLLEYATQHKASDDKVFSNVGEFFDMHRMLEFAAYIIQKSEDDERLALFKHFEPSLITWSTFEELEILLLHRELNEYIVFPYEPAYQRSEARYRENNGYHFLHFGLILPGFTSSGRYKILQTSRGRTVKKPVYRLFRLFHTVTAYDLETANAKTLDRGYKWLLQFPWKKYKGVKTEGFTRSTPPKYSPYNARNLALRLTQKG